ncbi:MAG: putative Ig domain-containing protein [Candidatus Latescibacterota bacterium]|nr:MAG: putative Ig domain-containing protein [Candidatus Latescibacterota bacterium]
MFPTVRLPYLSIVTLSIALGLCIAVAMPVPVQSQPVSCPASMSHYWKLDETTGPPFADHYAGTDATCTNCPTSVAGIVNGAQDFNGSNDEVNAPNDGSWDWGKDDSFSIVYWMKTSASTAGNRVIVARDDAVNSLHWWVGCDDNGTVRFQLRDINGNGAYIGNKGSALNDGVWHFVVAVRDNDADMNRIYVDGAKIDSASHDYTAGFGGTADLNIGYINIGGHYRFDGIVDEVATFDKALTDAEIMAFYNDGLSGTGYCGVETVAPTIISMAVTDAKVGQLYTYDVEAIGTPAPTFQLTTNPAGMTIDANTGVIQWTPASAGSEPVTVVATNSAGTDDQSFTINVTEPLLCPDGVVAYWKLDETSGTSYADSYDGNHGQASTSAPTPAAGIVGGAQDFNGTSDRITVDDDPSLDWAGNQSLTIELWAKFTNVSGQNKVMIGRDDGGGGRPHWWIGAQQNSGKAMFVLFDTNNNGTYIVGSTSLNDDNWHYITAVKDESVDRIRLYVDGVKQDSAYHDYTAGFEATTTLGIGYMAYAGTPNYFYAGLLDEIALYGRALDDIEIQQHYTNGLAALEYCPESHVAPLIVSVPVTSASVGVPYSYDVDATGVPGPQYSLLSSPAGMTIDTATGVIDWTPTAAGNYAVEVRAFNTAGADTQSFNIDIPATPVITSSPVTEGTVGEPYTYDVDATGFPAPTYALLTQPAGMTINPTTGVIDWTPAATGDYAVQVRAFNTAGADSQSFDIHVGELLLCPELITHYWAFDETTGPPYADDIAGTDATCTACPTPVTGTVNGAQSFDGTSDEVNAPNDGSWDWDKDDSFTIAYWMNTSASTAGNRVIVARDDPGSALHWWVGCDDNGTVRFQLRDTNGNGAYIGNKGSALNDGVWHLITAVRDNSVDMNRIYVDGVKVDSAYHDYTAGFGGSANLNIGYINLGGHYRYEGIVDEVATFDKAMTQAEILIHYNNGLIGKGYCSFEPTAPTITSTPAVDAVVGQPYAYDVDASGLPAPTYALTVYPAGMTIDTVSGVIDWTPTAAGSVPVTVEATNSSGTDTQSYTIVVTEPPSCPEDMICFWKFDETSGTVYEDFYADLDGQALVSPPTPVAGIVNGAQDFNGTSDRVTVDDHAALDWASDQSITIELWAKFTNVSSRNKVMIGRDDGGGGKPHWWIGAQQNTGAAMFVMLDSNGNGTYIIGSTSLNDGEWHHIAGVKDDSVDRIRLYVDGAKQDSAYHDYTAGFGASTSLGIGYMAYGGTPDYFYDGSLDEIAIYGRSLSDAEIEQHYTDGQDAIDYCTGSTVATLLRGYTTYVVESQIVIGWELFATDPYTRFVVMRAEGHDGPFVEIVNPAIDRAVLSFEFTDDDLKPGSSYRYRVDVIDENGRWVLFETNALSTPAAVLTLHQNHPNPFNPNTTIQFLLPEKGHASLSVFDARGRRVVDLINKEISAGPHEVVWDAKDARGNAVSSGVYFYRLRAGDNVLTRKMILIK